MGTFHDDMGELHGITVVATAGDTVYVGRCHEMDAQRLLLLDADQHTENEDGRSNREYLERAARFGVWKKHDKLLLPTADITEVVPLGQYYQGLGSSAVAAAAPKEQVALVAELVAAPAVGTDGDPVTLTPSAHEEVVRLLSEEKNRGQGLRLGVSGGGCSGLVYKVEFDARADGDVVVPRDGFEIFLDPKSVIYLRGVVLDFQAGLSGRGFQFTNPNASNTCGCGESFAV
jgi:iron-sulfur cluster assembly protein